MPDEPASLLDRVAALAALPSLDPPAVERVLGVRLVPARQQPNPYFTLYEGRPRAATAASGVALADLRLPKAPPTKGGGGEFLVLTVAAEGAPGEDEVRRRFGNSPALDVPPPEQPAYAVRYLYQIEGHPVSFALTAGKDGKVVSVSFDRVKK